eukprot:2831986-Prorocentrum_lima.AAC.1
MPRCPQSTRGLRNIFRMHPNLLRQHHRRRGIMQKPPQPSPATAIERNNLDAVPPTAVTCYPLFFPLPQRSSATTCRVDTLRCMQGLNQMTGFSALMPKPVWM